VSRCRKISVKPLSTKLNIAIIGFENIELPNIRQCRF